MPTMTTQELIMVHASYCSVAVFVPSPGHSVRCSCRRMLYGVHCPWQDVVAELPQDLKGFNALFPEPLVWISL